MLAMKQRVLRLVGFWFVMGMLLWPAAAMAADDEGPRIDARVQNFQKVVSVQEGGTALTWLLLIFLTLICLAALFKNAKRTHLD